MRRARLRLTVLGLESLTHAFLDVLVIAHGSSVSRIRLRSRNTPLPRNRKWPDPGISPSRLRTNGLMEENSDGGERLARLGGQHICLAGK